MRFWSGDLALFGRALRVTSDNHLAHGYVGKALAAQALRPGNPSADEQDRAALDHYRRALALRENYPEVHYNLGNLLLRRGQFDDAILHYQRAIEQRPRMIDAQANLAAACAYAGRFAEAETHYRATLALDPGREQARAGLERVRQLMREGPATGAATGPASK